AERFIAGGAGAGLNPFLMGTVRLVIEDVKAGVRETRQKTIALPAEAASLSADWAQSREIDSGALGPATTPPGGATYEPVPASWQRAATFKSAATALKGWAAANEAVAIFRNASLRIASRAGETRLEFEGRCRNESAKRRDEELRAYQTKIEEKVRKLRARAEKEQLDVARDEQAAQLRKTQEAVGIGSAVLGALFGSRRSLGTSVLGAGTRHQMSARADAQAEKSRAEAEAARADLDALKAQAEGEVKEIEERWTAAAAAIEETVLRPKKTAIEVAEMAVLWAAELP
ncbi:MAG TPA: hypothetical protein VE404_03265, partial [Verrucomicrobiae bacterium]|nr:hypothetical protein [Verrucomicrobiae bacterium]